MLRFAKNN